MKKRILTLSLLLITAISYSFADNIEKMNNRLVAASFQKDFSEASQVKWETSKAFIKASFHQNGQAMFAYYSQQGELIAVSRYLSPSDLPINQFNSLKKDYSSFWVSDLFEINADSETAYYVTVQNADYTIVLKSTGSNSWEVYEKKKKD
jgi:hypothetical protein